MPCLHPQTASAKPGARIARGTPTAAPAAKYEIDVRYNAGDVIHAIFQNKVDALKFLQSFE